MQLLCHSLSDCSFLFSLQSVLRMEVIEAHNFPVLHINIIRDAHTQPKPHYGHIDALFMLKIRRFQAASVSIFHTTIAVSVSTIYLCKIEPEG